MSWRVLVVGDVVGTIGLGTLERGLETLRERHAPDFVIVNGENAASNGNGLAARGAKRIFGMGVDVITLGDHWFRKADLLPVLDENRALLRPCNYPPDAAGRGWGKFTADTRSAGPIEVGVVVVQGRVFMEPADNPFAAVERALEMLDSCAVRLVEVHAEATSEKIALGRFLDGRVAAVWGTHTHVATADAQLLPQGTAYITDIGMTGPHDGVIGRCTEPVITKMRTSMPAPFRVAGGDLRLNGALLDIDETTGRAEAIERVGQPVEL